MGPIRCLLIDDEKEATSRLAVLLGKIDDLKIIGIYNDPDSAFKAIMENKPDLVFSDVEMPKMSGFDLVNEVRKSGFNPTYIFVTGYNQYAIKAIKTAAFDYLVKPVDLDELKDAIKRFCETRPHLTTFNIDSEKIKILSDREKEIIKLIAQCKSSKDIAEILFISKNTVDTHRRHILEKLGLRNTHELIVFAMDNELMQ